MNVPKQAHVHALRQALELWIRWPRKDGKHLDRVELVKERLRLLINPSITDIYEKCATGEFTHVHILAHGAAYEEAGEQRFGLALCQQLDKNQPDIVSGSAWPRPCRPSSRIARAGPNHWLSPLQRVIRVIQALCWFPVVASRTIYTLRVSRGSLPHNFHSQREVQ